jgi:flagellum-specific peptidoglycan hydrolase FlgJ
MAIETQGSYNDFYNKMYTHAKTAHALTGIPIETILGQWALESAYGTSDLSRRAKNFAGIKATSKGKDFTSGQYAGYFTLGSFARDYARVMNLPYYEEVRNAGTVEGSIVAIGESPYAEDKSYTEKLRKIIKEMTGLNLSNPIESIQGGKINFVGWAIGIFIAWFLFIR